MNRIHTVKTPGSSDQITPDDLSNNIDQTKEPFQPDQIISQFNCLGKRRVRFLEGENVLVIIAQKLYYPDGNPGIASDNGKLQLHMRNFFTGDKEYISFNGTELVDTVAAENQLYSLSEISVRYGIVILEEQSGQTKSIPFVNSKIFNSAIELLSSGEKVDAEVTILERNNMFITNVLPH